MMQYRSGEVARIDRIENGWIVTYFAYKTQTRFFDDWDAMVAWLKEFAMWEDK
jgi:hypothetical protein